MVKIIDFKTKILPINELIPYSDNAKKHPKIQIKKIIKSIETYGFRQPVVLNNETEKVIVAGHGRVMAAKQIGINEVPCVFANDLSPELIKAYRLMDNRSAESDWEMPILEKELEFLKNIGLNLEITGFENMLKNLGTEDDFDPASIKEPKYKVTKGEVYQLGPHRLMCGDSTVEEDVKKLMNGKMADMVFTDPPYGVDYSAKNVFLNSISRGNRIQKDILGDTKQINIEELWKKSLTNTKNTLKEGSTFYITFSGDKLLLLLLQTLRNIQMPEKQTLIWVKNNHVLGRSDYNYKHEMILYGWKEGKAHNFYATHDTTVWEVDKPTKNDLHPTMKPIQLITKAINNSSQEGEIIIDYFGGSGSTLIACEQTNRTCYMMELDTTYVSIIIERWEKLTGKTALKLNDD